MAMGTTGKNTAEIYSGIYHLAYERNGDLGQEYCLCPSEKDYVFSFHLCEMAVSGDCKERIAFLKKEGETSVKINVSKIQYCNRYKWYINRVKLYADKAELKNSFDALEDLESEKGRRYTEIISMALTQAMRKTEESGGFWPLYCAFHPNCFMYDICNIVLNLFGCIGDGNSYAQWLEVFSRRLCQWLQIYETRSEWAAQYEEFVKRIHERMSARDLKCAYKVDMFKAEMAKLTEEKLKCDDLLRFLSVSPNGKTLYLEYLKAIVFTVHNYFREWESYGFKDNKEFVDQCESIFAKCRLDVCPDSDEIKRFVKYTNLEPASSKTARLNARSIYTLVEKIYNCNQLKMYWVRS